LALLLKNNSVLVAALDAERASGKIEGKVADQVEGKIEALLAVLVARGISPTEPERSRLVAEKDPARVDAWLAAAIHCTSVAELLGQAGSRGIQP
jgi:hypothetical protein